MAETAESKSSPQTTDSSAESKADLPTEKLDKPETVQGSVLSNRAESVDKINSLPKSIADIASTTKPPPVSEDEPNEPPPTKLKPKPAPAPATHTELPEAQVDTSPQRNQREVYIAVMGQTGTGKSSFINQLTGKTLKVGHGLRSCTENIQIVRTTIGGVPVTLIDTPGFDDGSKDDGQILLLIGAWLKMAHKQDKLLSGVIYLHRITDLKVGGASTRSLATLKTMCGTKNYKSVALVTTMWETLANLEVGEQREKQLVEETDFWEHMKSQGARICRHNGKKETARDIVKQFLPEPRVVLDIQDQMSSNDGIVGKTEAGMLVKQYLEDQKMLYMARITELRGQILLLQKRLDEGESLQQASGEHNDEKKIIKMEKDIGYLMTTVDQLLKDAKAQEPEAQESGAQESGAQEAGVREPRAQPGFFTRLLEMIRRTGI